MSLKIKKNNNDDDNVKNIHRLYFGGGHYFGGHCGNVVFEFKCFVNGGGSRHVEFFGPYGAYDNDDSNSYAKRHIKIKIKIKIGIV